MAGRPQSRIDINLNAIEDTVNHIPQLCNNKNTHEKVISLIEQLFFWLEK